MLSMMGSYSTGGAPPLDVSAPGLATFPSAVAEPEHPWLLEIIDHLPYFVSLQDLNGRFVFSNLPHTRLLGMADRSEVIGRTRSDFIPLALAQALSARDRIVLESGQAVYGQLENVSGPEEQPRWLAISRIPLTNQRGEICALLSVSQDETTTQHTEASLRQMEALYRTLIEGLPQRVFFKSPESAFVSVNATFAKDLGQTPAGLIGKTDFDLFPRELAEKYRADDQRVMQSRKPEILEEANISEGNERVVEVVKAPVTDTDGRLLGLLGIFTDITDRKRAAEKLKAFARQLQRSNRELEDFAYVASHDLQEPLRKVVVFGSRLHSKYGTTLGAEGQDYLERMLKATTRMQSLINDLLTFARVTTKAQPFARVDLGAVATEVLVDLETRIEQVGGKVQVETLPTLEADPLQMRQLLQNLIGNGLKFRRPNVPPVVTLSAHLIRTPKCFRSAQSAGGMWEITVADNGIGFEEKYGERIFQVFQRLHNRTEYDGSGIGLAVCRKIAERHGGAITAEGHPGTGARFIIHLPAAQPPGAPSL